MRVSKVKVTDRDSPKGQMVNMFRSTEKGQLIYSDEIPPIDRTDAIIPKQKQDSFVLSITNKTVIKWEIVKKLIIDKKRVEPDKIWDIYKIKQIHRSLSVFIKNVLTEKQWRFPDKIRVPENINKELLEVFLNHKFRKTVSFKNETGDTISFSLSELILKSVKDKSALPLSPYVEWKEWFVRTKSFFLKKSIEGNRISTGKDNVSKRREALLSWKEDFISSGKVPLKDLHVLFGIDELASKLRGVELGIESRNKPGTPANKNEYHRNLKSCLHEHQKSLFGKEAPHSIENRENIRLYAYNLEITKYLEHYFPIKKSKRTNSKEQIAYYLSTDTIKTTIAQQLTNAVRLLLLQEGKYTYHGLRHKAVTSDDLTDLRTGEAFAKQFLDCCAFAACNLRNIVDKGQFKDILGKNDFNSSINKKSVDEGLLSLFFGPEINGLDEEERTDLLYAVRYTISARRNSVIHYKKGAPEEIYSVSNYETNTNTNPFYKETKFKEILHNEIKAIPRLIALQLMTGGVLDFYRVDEVVSLFKTHEFGLSRSIQPFAPSFKRVMKGGTNYQNASNDKQFYDLQLTAYRDKGLWMDNPEAWEARYFLLKLIYVNLFLPQFTDNKEDFFKLAVEKVLQVNKEVNQKNGNRFRQAFSDIRMMRRHEPISEYMAYIQSSLRMEEDKKEDKNAGNDKEAKRINFEKFLLQVFVKGFDTFLLNKDFEFVQNPCICLKGESDKERAKERLGLKNKIADTISVSGCMIDPDNDNHISFYVFCKMLDAKHLNDLRNEMIKYGKSVSSDKLKCFIEIIELCLLASYIDSEKGNIIREDFYLKFIENGSQLTDFGELYVQSDETSPIPHSGVENILKYGAQNLLEHLMKRDGRFLISQKDYEEWLSLKEIIAEKTMERANLHEEWEKSSQEEKKEFTKAKEYFEVCQLIDRYNWLDNKLHMNHLNKLHNLVIEILGRMVGFTYLFERDYIYFCQVEGMPHELDKLKFDKGLPKLGKRGHKTDKGTTDNTEEDERLKFLKGRILSESYRDVRNFIAHFNYLTKVNNLTENNANKNKSIYSLIELINELRDLVSYDRKIKNAISKSMIDLFERNGMILKLQFDDQMHKLQVKSITPRKLVHLGGKQYIKDENGKNRPITTNQVDPLFCDMCKELLEMK